MLSPLSFLLFLIVFFLSSGCASPPTVVLWHSYRGAEEAALVRLAAGYEEKTGVHVELLAVPFDAYTAKLAAARPAPATRVTGTA